MSTFAAVMTGKGTGAIATIQIFGAEAEETIKKIFEPAGSIYALGKALKLEPGKILLGKITDNSRTIDKITIGCEDTNNIAIHCHGNPIIVADIMKLLAKHNVEPITNTEMLTKITSEDKTLNTIAIEAKLAQITAKTLQGTKIIANQIESGLAQKASEWLADETSLEKLKTEAAEILKNSDTAKLLIESCTIVLAGPPNSGKSTLLNYIAGKEKAIVTDIKGTTRDYVTATCHIGPLLAKIIDTAGLDEQLSSHIEKESQKTSIQLLEKADIILLILDSNESVSELSETLIERLSNKKVITVLNKSDLPARLDTSKLPKALTDTIPISAKTGSGIEKLLKKIRDITAIDWFDIKTPVCFTSRHQYLVKKLANTTSKDTASEIITELLNGSLGV